MTAHDHSSANGPAPSTGTPRSFREFVTTTLINAGPPLVAYYALRLFGLEPYLALIGAIVIAVAQGVFAMARNRKVEPVNALVLIAAACSLTVGLATKNPRLIQLIELLPGALFVWSLVVSSIVRKPVTKGIAGAVVPRLAEAALPERGWTEQDVQDWNKLHIRLCLWSGLVAIGFQVLAVIWIFSLEVDVSQILLAVVGLSMTTLLVANAIIRSRAFVKKRDGAGAEPKTQTGSPA